MTRSSLTHAHPRRALLILNAASRMGSIAAEAARAKLRDHGLEIVEPGCDGAAAVSSCIIAHRERVDCVIVGGGDGTLNAAGRGLVETGLPLGVLPLGTANDFARSLGVPADLDAAIRIIGDGYTHRIDIGDVNGHAFFNVASVGLAADLAKSLTSEDKKRFGRLSYALSAIRLLMSASPFHATLIEGETAAGNVERQAKTMVKTFQIAVGNGRFYGGGNVIVSDARIDDGWLDLYSLEFAQVWRMALMVRAFKLGQHGAVREVRTARGGHFEIVTRKPRPVNADGELVTQTPAVFTQKKLAVCVYVPETCALVRVPV